MTAGCRSATSAPTTTAATGTEAPSLRPSDPPGWFEDRERLDAAVDESIRHELATRLDVGVADVTRRGAAPVLFRDTALGCPTRSEFVAGAQIRGWIAYYEVAGRMYRVHGAQSDDFRLCDLPDLDVIPELER